MQARHPLAALMLESESWLMQRVLDHAAHRLFGGLGAPGSRYYDQLPVQATVRWLRDELRDLSASREPRRTFSKALQTAEGVRHFDVRLERMHDVSEKFVGTVVILSPR